MCTSGVIATEVAGTSEVLAFKTLDSGYSATTWHGIVRRAGGLRALAMGRTERPGVNSGVNEAGVGVMLSYLDNITFDSMGACGSIPDDLRWIANDEALTHCESAQEMCNFLGRYFEGNKSLGGNHLIFDKTGVVLTLEHQSGDVRVANRTAQGWAARGNDNHLLEDSKFSKLPQAVHRDRRIRCEFASQVATDARSSLAKMGKEQSVSVLKKGMSAHEGGGKGLGSVCVHGLDVPGARYSSCARSFTATAVIFDAPLGRMTFSQGNPCCARWHSIALN